MFFLPVVLLEWRFTNSYVVLLFDVGSDPVEGVTFVHQRRIETARERHVFADPDVHGRRGNCQHKQQTCEMFKKEKNKDI